LIADSASESLPLLGSIEEEVEVEEAGKDSVLDRAFEGEGEAGGDLEVVEDDRCV